VSGGATSQRDETTVGPGEAVRFAPGDYHYQQGRNEGEQPVEALALGAPKESTGVRVLQPCPECDGENLRTIPTDEGFSFECPECGVSVELRT
jgi:peptide subunit release factor 1 (eRF1)